MAGNHRVHRKLLFVAIAFLALSIVLAVISLFPIHPGGTQSNVLVNDTFKLSPNEVYRQGLGSFSKGENVSLFVQPLNPYPENFSIITYNGTQYSTFSKSSIAYNFTTKSDYYEAAFTSNASNEGALQLQAFVQEQKITFPCSWLTEPSRLLFILSTCLAMFAILKLIFAKNTKPSPRGFSLPSLGKNVGIVIIVLLAFSLVFWFFLVSINTNPLATFENWYTDHARDTYVSSLFLKNGFSVFSQPLNNLANTDNSTFKFVTWPQMPNLYPLGSIFLFLPFGIALQNGANTVSVYKIEIGIFLLFASLCLYLFLKTFLKKDLEIGFKLLGVFIIYVTLIIYAADGMFDSVAFLFVVIALSMFLTEHYEHFFLLTAAATFFKYQAGIFLLPLLIFGLIKMYQSKRLSGLLNNKIILLGIVLFLVNIFTALLSAPYLITINPKLIMNGIDAFASNAQISWSTQAISILVTLAVSLVYSVYMLNKNSLLSLSAVFLLLPSFMLPYFQYWYLPFIFVYVLIPQKKSEAEITMLWLVFLMVVLAYSGASYNFLPNFHALGGLSRLFLSITKAC